MAEIKLRAMKRIGELVLDLEKAKPDKRASRRSPSQRWKGEIAGDPRGWPLEDDRRRYEDLAGPPRGARAAVGFGGLPLGITLFVEFATRLY